MAIVQTQGEDERQPLTCGHMYLALTTCGRRYLPHGNSSDMIDEHTFENMICKMSALLLRPVYGVFQVIPGVYVGNIRDSKDKKQLEANHITHILSIHTNASKIHQVCFNKQDVTLMLTWWPGASENFVRPS